MILLFILGLLALFSLVAVSFVVVSRIHRRGAHHASMAERTGNSPQSLMMQAALQVLRGSNGPHSSIGPHSLLEDIYGHGGFQARVEGNPSLFQINGQPTGLIDIAINTSVYGPVNVLDTTSGYYNGRVLTVISGSCAGASARIVDYEFSGTEIPPGRGSQGRFRVLWPKGTQLPAVGDLLFVNGAPFSGTGFGLNVDRVTLSFDPLTQVLLDRMTTVDGIPDVPWALIPNAAFFPRKTGDAGFDANYFGTAPIYHLAGPGGANEDYDAPDFQNMLLALRLVDPTGGPNSPSRVILPSLHRPDLLRYWVARQGVANWAALPPALLRRVMLRPNSIDHPNFDGSNPNFDPVLGMSDPLYRWDVDNDADGRPDSVWVDIGLPVQTTLDGRNYKPLVAILCEDLDGKLNLNAHGNLNQLVQGVVGSYGTRVAAGINETSGDASARAIFADGGSGTQQYPIGQGYGPAEVNLGALFSAANTTEPDPIQEYRWLLTGKQDTSVTPIREIQGRYGERDASLGTLTASAGRTIDTGANSANTYMQLQARNLVAPAMERANFQAWLAHYFFPDDHFNMRGWTNRLYTSFSTPPDLDGDGILGIDPSGNMYYPRWLGTNYNFGMGEWGDKLNNPYQIDLYSSPDQVRWDGAAVVTTDAPFQAVELERLLRFGDADAGALNSRLYQSTVDNSLAYNTFNLAAYRHLVTTESWDLPVPSVAPTADLLTTALGTSVLNNMVAADLPGLHLVDLIRARSLRDGSDFTAAGATPVDKAGFTLRDLGMELRRGLKLDLNRPFGDGRDQGQAPWTNSPIALPLGDGVVDDPSEAAAGETIWNGAFTDAAGNPIVVDVDQANNDNRAYGAPSVPSLSDQQARQEYAKNLYVLMMLVLDQNFAHQAYSPTDIAERTKLATQVAQWAVNVVDFRDADSIMTSFEFDVLPFTDENGDGDPWDVDGNLNTDEKTDSGDVVRREVVWGVERPELLITETLAFHDRRTEDLGDDDSGINNHTIDNMDEPDPHYDQRVPPQGSLFIELYNPWSRDTALSGELYNNFGKTNAEVDLGKVTPVGNSPVWRLIVTRNDRAPDRVEPGTQWASDPTDEIDRVIYFSTADPGVSDTPSAVRYFKGQAAPGIEPGQYAVIGPADVTEAGFTGLVRRFRLDDSTAMPANRFTVEDTTSELHPYAGQGTPASATIRNVVAVPIDQADRGSTRPNISEPPDGYDAPSGMSGDYDPPRDIPLDHPDNRDDLSPADQDVLWSNSTTPPNAPFRHIHLQRLANPLVAWNVPGEPGYDNTRPVNPYLTIDTMPVDLTVYNSLHPAADMEPSLAVNQDPNFRSRQRTGNRNETGLVGNGMDLWSQASDLTGTAVFDNDAPQPAPEEAPIHTLGYLNESFLVQSGGERIRQSDNYNIDPNSSGTPYNFIGMPKGRPFASLHWPNRPFINQYELLHVPSYSSAWMLAAHWIYQAGTTTHYSHTNQLTIPNVTADDLWLGDTAFRHLMPWMVHSTPTGAGIAPHIYRALEYVHVPSNFTGADEYLNPAVFQYGMHSLDQSVDGSGNFLYNHVASFHPPFNKVSRYREPGKVNLNTIFDTGITWQALTNDYPFAATATGFWTNTVSHSRAGYDLAGNPYGVATSPTLLAQPFRSSSGNLLVPIPEMAHRGLDTANPRHQGIDFTLLRSNPTTPNLPLLAETVTTNPATDPEHNSYFHYQLLTKLGNNVTTRSNVYAVWITLGYFEVDRVAVSDAYPDGWQLGRELGSDSGEIERHRSFFLIDRSIPVGFQRGEDLNVLDCFLIRRFIE